MCLCNLCAREVCLRLKAVLIIFYYVLRVGAKYSVSVMRKKMKYIDAIVL